MRTITMLELRRDTAAAVAAVSRGERLLLTYRGKPIARIEPVRPDAGTVPEDDPLLRIEDFAVDGRGGRLTNTEIDRALYGA